MSATIHSSVLVGVTAVPVEVRVTRRSSEGQLQLIWKGDLAEAAQRETSIRVRSSLPDLLGRPTGVFEVAITLPPGCNTSALDLPIAVGVWAAAHDMHLQKIRCVGELALDGRLRLTRGAIAHARAAAADDWTLVLPEPSVGEVHLVPGARVLAAHTFAGVVAYLHGGHQLDFAPPAPALVIPPMVPDLADIKGCVRAKRALEIAAAGGHSLLLVGAPGTGKTMLAQRLLGILPAMTAEEQLEVATIRDAAGLGGGPGRPFRAPHHTCSEAGLIGGGITGRPGEVTLAHHGVLFLDELPEWRAPAIAALARVLQRGFAEHAMPAKPAVVVAAQNPCPCGYAGSTKRECRCSESLKAQYRKRPGLAMRFELVVDLDADTADDQGVRETSAEVQARVEAACLRPGWTTVAQTIAALAGSGEVLPAHKAEAESFGVKG